MYMLKVQKFLLNNTLADLKAKHGVVATIKNNKFSLNYDQIESKENDPIAQECRGLILSTENNLLNSIGKTKILAYPFNRFFNYGQQCCNIDWSNIKIFEKLDGTLCILYYDDNQWHVATRSVPEADVISNSGFTFRTLFEKALFDTIGLSFDSFVNALSKDITYCFELTSPYNRVVVGYDDNRIHLIGARNINTLKELDIINIQCEIPCAPCFNLKTINDIFAFVNSRDPLLHEGVVVVDHLFNRAKIKSVKYCLAHKAQESICNDRDFLNLLLHEKEDDVVNFLPEKFVNRINELKSSLIKLQSICDEVPLNYSRKEFAISINANDKIWSPYMFAKYDGKANSIREFAMKKSINNQLPNSLLDSILMKLGI